MMINYHIESTRIMEPDKLSFQSEQDATEESVLCSIWFVS